MFAARNKLKGKPAGWRKVFTLRAERRRGKTYGKTTMPWLTSGLVLGEIILGQDALTRAAVERWTRHRC